MFHATTHATPSSKVASISWLAGVLHHTIPYHTILFNLRLPYVHHTFIHSSVVCTFFPVYRWKCGCTSAAVVILKLRCMPLFTPPPSSSILPLPTRTQACFGVGRGHGEEKEARGLLSFMSVTPNLLHTNVKTSSP